MNTKTPKYSSTVSLERVVCYCFVTSSDNNTETDNTRVYLFCKTPNNKFSFEHIKENIIVNFIFLTNSIE